MQEILGLREARIEQPMLFVQNCMELAENGIIREEKAQPGFHFWASYDIGPIITVKYSSFNDIDRFKAAIVDSYSYDPYIIYLRTISETTMHQHFIDPVRHKIDVFGFVNTEKDPNWLVRPHSDPSLLPRDVEYFLENQKQKAKKSDPNLRINSVLKQAKQQKPFGPVFAFLT